MSGRRGGWGRILVGLSLVTGVAALLSASARRGDPTAQVAPHRHDGTPPSAAAVRDGFEHRDVKTTSVAVAMVIGVAAIAVSIGGLFALLALFHRQDREAQPLTPQQTAIIEPPGPPLQSRPELDIAALRRREAAALTAYRWLSPDKATAQIPIERAMALVVGQPLSPPPKAAP